MGLTWCAVDFDNETILVNKQLQRGKGNVLDSTKNDKSRRITPAPYVMLVLREQKQKQLQWENLAGQLWNNASNLCFTNEFGGALVHGTVSKEYKRIISKVGFSDSRFHDLRHSYAVAALSSGDDVKTVQENLGHHDAGFTLNQYGHVTEKMKKESARRMEAFINGLQKTG